MSSRVNPPTVLLVDDDRNVIEIIRTFLDDEGIPTLVAFDGDQALQTIRGGLHPDLVILDLHMPKVDGWAFCAALSSKPSLSDIPIIILTGGTQRPIGIKSSSVVGILHKPVDIPGMLGMIEATLARTRGGHR